MKNHLLQDMRKKATKQAYIQEVLDCSHDVIIEFCNENEALTMPNLADIKAVSDFMLINVFNRECNYARNQQLYPNHHMRVTKWVVNRMTFGCYVIDSCKWLVDNNLVNAEFIPKNQDITERMQLADERHYQYLAKILLDNASQKTLNIVYRKATE